MGDGNAFAQWLLWSHGGMLVDEEGKVAINSRADRRGAGTTCGSSTPAFVARHARPGSTRRNNRAFSSQEIFLTSNGVSLYFTLKNDPKHPRPSPRTPSTRRMPKGRAAPPPHTSTVLNAMVFRHTRYPNAAKAFLTFMLEAGAVRPLAARGASAIGRSR